MTYKLTNEEGERILNTVEINNPHERLNQLAAITRDIGDRLDVGDLEELSHYIGVYEVVGTGMGMSLPTVLSHLSELLEIHSDGDIPSHGGSEEFHEDITLNERFDHNCYYALQTLYGNMIYDQIIETCESRSKEGASSEWNWGIGKSVTETG